MSTPKRIAIVVAGLGIGGVELTLLRLLSHRSMAQFDVDVICLYDEDNRLAPRFQELGVNVVVLKMFDYSRHFLLRFNPRAFLQLLRRFRDREYDLVHTFLPQPNRVGGIAARLAGLNARIETLCNMKPGRRSRSVVMLDRFVGRSAHAIVGMSRAICEWDRDITGLSEDLYRVIHNGIEVQRFDPESVKSCRPHAIGAANDRFVVGTIGRLHPQKAFDTLIRAFSLLDPAARNLRLVIAGDGPERHRLEQHTRDLGIAEAVEFLGFREDTPEVLACFDVFVLSSIYEGLGNVLLEALSMELPVVSTDLPPVREIITPHVTGILVPKEDPAAMAEAIEGLIENGKGRAALGKNGRRLVVDRFSDVEMAEAYVELYDEVFRACTS